MLEYACPVWHPHLPKDLCDSTEFIQKRALRCIYPEKLYHNEDLLSELHISSLQERRDSICEKYFNTISKPGSNSTVFSQQLMKAITTHVLRRILYIHWLGQTVFRIDVSHGVYVNFKDNFSHCASSHFSYVFSFLFYLLFGMSCLLFYHHFADVNLTYCCKDNKILSLIYPDPSN